MYNTIKTIIYKGTYQSIITSKITSTSITAIIIPITMAAISPPDRSSLFGVAVAFAGEKRVTSKFRNFYKLYKSNAYAVAMLETRLVKN